MITFAMLQGVANLLADWSSPRFTEDANRASQPAKTFRQKLDLRGFPAAFRSFKSDEYAAHVFNPIGRSDTIPSLPA